MVINVSESYICFSEVIFYFLFNVMCFFKRYIYCSSKNKYEVNLLVDLVIFFK